MLTVSRLGKTYPGPVVALEEIDLQLDRGLFGLLGPNGAGKSTLMRTLATLQLPDSGSARLDDIDLIAEPHRARRTIGYLPQEMGVYPRVTAREMLDYLATLKGIGPHRERRKHVEQQLARVHLADVADRRLDTFSGGMKQRFGIATAFLGQPSLVIVDEPTAGLDPYERRRFQLMLSERARDCVLLLSTHIVEDIAGLCENMALIDRGRLLQRGSPRELLQRIEGCVWEFPIAPESLEEARRRYRVLSFRPRHERLSLRVYSKQRPTPWHGDCDEGAVGAIEPDLEDLYAYHVEQRV
ncbi:putative ABC transporter ATP-binding protein YbhF [Planctomycetes bacterium Pan216]|uniref:Putative ABC transporter ATP-binding protein YbhF n=1 Tax=Kolteria novifilia TaxID=2527975 RepID=A0A518B4Q0_9BACT|nr:putative ABC transporter ATP-binding protein YbhF [Planctomycetes bacterium Pan216]